MSYVKYIADVQHYNEVLSKVASVKKSLLPRGIRQIPDSFKASGEGALSSCAFQDDDLRP